MYAFDGNYALKFFESASDIFMEYAAARLRLYEARREHQLQEIGKQLQCLRGKMTFVGAVLSDRLQIRGVSKEALLHSIEALNIPKCLNRNAGLDHEYLLQMNIIAFTQEKIAALRSEIAGLEAEEARLQHETAVSLWSKDLKIFEDAFTDYEKRVAVRHQEDAPAKAQACSVKRRRTSGTSKHVTGNQVLADCLHGKRSR
jgi:DNA topoisomerase-2